MRIQLEGLTPNQQYGLSFRSRTETDASEWSQILKFTPVGDVTPPAVPTGFAAAVSGTSFICVWNAVTDLDFDHYKVKVYSPAANQTVYFITKDVKFEFTIQANRQSFTTAEAECQFSVCAVDQIGNESAYTAVSDLTNPAPAAVTNLTVAQLVDSIGISWKAVTDNDLAGYEIHAGSTAGFTADSTNIIGSGNFTSFVYQTTTYSTDTYIQVFSVDLFGTKSAMTQAGPVRPKSAATVDTVAPGSPVGLAATITTNADATAFATVSWTANTESDLSGYVVNYRKTGTTDWATFNADNSTTTAVVNGLTPYVNYDFRIRAYDHSANYSAWSAVVTTTTAATDTAPSQPAVPTVASNTSQIQVSHDGTKQGGGALESDVVTLDVYADTSAATFTPSLANKLGSLRMGPAISGVYKIPSSAATGTSQTWYVRVIAVDRGGNQSAPSTGVTSSVPLIGSTNIGDATITNAKVTALDVNKLTAGTGVVNDFTIKANLTLGDGTTNGAIKSFDYAAGSAGFSLSSAGLEINAGSVAAAALKIQSSPNILPARYGLFPLLPSAYTFAGANSEQTPSVIGTDGTVVPFVGNQMLKIVYNNTTVARAIYLAPSSSGLTDSQHAFPIEPGRTYILSAWVYSPTATAAGEINLNTYQVNNAGAVQTGIRNDCGTVPAATWTRVHTTVTIPTNWPNQMILAPANYLVGSTRTVYYSGIQVEPQIGSATTPSGFNPPSITQIDGAFIRTGTIQSTVTTTVNGVAQPNWSINVAGAAQFGSAVVRGTLTIGASGDPDAGASYVASGNFVAGSTGWKIDSSGGAEFNTGTFRGNLAIGKPTTIAAPSGLTIASYGFANSWSLPTATYYYKITGTNSGGETTGSNEVSLARTNGTSPTLKLSWPALPVGLTGLKIYRGTAAGAENILVATISSSSAGSFIEDSRAGTSQAIPTTNTTANANQIVKVDTNGLYIGNVTYASAPFTIDLAGNITATGGTITSFAFQNAKSGRRTYLGHTTEYSSKTPSDIVFYSGNSGENGPGVVSMDVSGANGGQSVVMIESPDNGSHSWYENYGDNYAAANSTATSQLNIGPAANANIGPLSWSTNQATSNVTYTIGGAGDTLNTGAVSATSLSVSGATTLTGALNSGDITTGNIGASGAVTITGNIAVNGGQFKSNAAYVAFFTGGSGALPIKVGSLTVSASYSDGAASNGLYVSGPCDLAGVYNLTSTFAANVGIATSPLARMYRLTSSRRYKVDIEQHDISDAAIMSLVPKTYIDKGQYDAAVEAGEPTDTLTHHIGLIAEEVAEIDELNEILVPKDPEGRPDSVNYDRVGVILVPMVQRLNNRVKALEAIIAEYDRIKTKEKEK